MFGLRAFLLISMWTPVISAVPVQEGVYIEQELVYQNNPQQPAMYGRQRIWMTPGFVRNEMVFDQDESVAIFDFMAKDLILISSKEKQYIRMTFQDYQRIVSMRLTNAKLNERDSRPELQKTKKHKKIGKWNCTKYVFRQRGKISIRVEMWIGENTGIRFDDFIKIMDQLGMQKMLGRLSDYVSELPGYPVELTAEQTIAEQMQKSTIKVVSIEKGPVDPALFKVPEGYKRIQETDLGVDLKPQGDH